MGWELFFAIPVIFGVATPALNILQLWCLHKHFRRHVNPLMVVIFHLSVAGKGLYPRCMFFSCKWCKFHILLFPAT